MTISSLVRTAGLLVAGSVIAASAMAQSAAGGNAARPLGVAGYLNTTTGVFTPIARRVDAGVTPLAATAVSGTLKFVMTITLKSGVSADSPIVCTGFASVRDSDFSSEVSYNETKAIVAIRNGNSATCSVAIPYSWSLPNAAGSSVSLSYSVSAGSETGTTLRHHMGTLDSISVPATGTTTTRNLAVTL
jgi:hypothetical protein